MIVTSVDGSIRGRSFDVLPHREGVVDDEGGYVEAALGPTTSGTSGNAGAGCSLSRRRVETAPWYLGWESLSTNGNEDAHGDDHELAG